MFFIQLSGKFSRVKLAYLEAQLRPFEQLDKRPPWKAEGRTMQEYRAGAPVVETSSLGADHHGSVSDYFEVFKSVTSISAPGTLRLNLRPVNCPTKFTR